jgi:hypothetical protein
MLKSCCFFSVFFLYLCSGPDGVFFVDDVNIVEDVDDVNNVEDVSNVIAYFHLKSLSGVTPSKSAAALL